MTSKAEMLNVLPERGVSCMKFATATWSTQPRAGFSFVVETFARCTSSQYASDCAHPGEKDMLEDGGRQSLYTPYAEFEYVPAYDIGRSLNSPRVVSVS